MMPGEAPPAATPAGEAAATACANCGALQQNLNEYVAALIALKQKIIDTDHLLTEYQQKCNELEAAKRENNTLHHQVEQMFQKISPLEMCEEELGSVKAELEEKKSSLKIYQETHLEYVRVKEEMDKSDIVKKKLETKVRKLEEDAAKHIQEFKQLKGEKKVLEKELKKAQEKIDGFPAVKHKKVLKNAETQSEKENPVGNLDKEKVKWLLEELWMCVIGSTGGDHISANDYFLGDLDSHSRTLGRTKMMQNPKKIKKSQGGRNAIGSLSQTCAAETTASSMHIKLDKKSTKYNDPVESKAMETTETGNSSFCEGSSLEDISQTDLSAINMNLFNKDQEHDESLQDVLKWVRPLPPLLSPIQFSPATTPDILFGDITDSSDEEMDDSAQTLENIIENYGQNEQAAESRREKHSAQSWNRCSSSSVNNANNGSQEAPERLRNLRNEELLLCSDPVTAKSKCLSEENAKSKDEEKYLNKNPDLMEIETATEIAVPSMENVREKMVNMTETKDAILIPQLMFINVKGQENTAELMPVQKMASSSPVQAFEESTDIVKNEEKELLTGTKEDDLSQSPKTDNQQHIEDPIFVVDSVAGLLEKCKHGSRNVSRAEGMSEEHFKDIQSVSNSLETRSLGEEATKHVIMDEQNKATERLGTGRNGELLLEQKLNISNCKFLSEKEHLIEQVEQQIAEVPFTYSIEKGSQFREENYISEERYDKQNESEENKEDEVMNAGISESQLNTTVVAGGCKKSLCHVDEAVQTEKECRTSFSMPTKKVDDNKVEIADSMTEGFKTVDIKEEECLQLQQLIDQKNNCKSPEEHPDCERHCILPAQASVIKDCLLQSEKPVETNTLVSEVESVTETTSKLGQVEDADTELQRKTKTHSISNNFYTMKTLMEGECKYPVEKDKTNDECSVTEEMLAKQKKNEDPTQSTQDVPQTNTEGIEIVLPVAVTAASQSTTEPMDISASNLEVFSKGGQSSDAEANTLYSVPVCITPSYSIREDITHFDHNTAEGLKNKEETSAYSQEKNHKPLACFSPSNNKNKESDSKLQALFTFKGSCSGESYKALIPETSNLNSVKTEDILLTNKSNLSDEAHITVPEKLRRPSKNSALEHSLDEAAAKETDEILNTDKSSEGVDTVKVMDSSVSLSSEGEECPLRKVSFIRTSPVSLMAKSKMETIRNIHTDTASNMTLLGGDRHEVASQKDNPAPGHDTDACADEAIGRTWDNSYSVELLYSNEKASMKLKASVAKDKSEGEVAKESISAVASLLNQEVICNQNSVPRKSSVSTLEIDSDITPDTKCSGASIETSRNQSHFCKNKLNSEQDMNFTASTCSTNLEQNHLTSHHVDDDSNISHKKECYIKNNGDTCAVKATPHNLESSNCSSKPQKLVLEKLESLVSIASCTENSADKIHMPSDSITVSNVKDSHDIASHERKRKSQYTLLSETILASTDTAAPTKQYPQTLIKIREEMGQPLPPLLPPLMATPPRTVRPLSTGTSLTCQSSLPSSLEELISPVHKTPVPPVLMSPMSDTLKCNSPASLTTPSPCEMPVGQRILSSPLQFCATTPKHALPVPGRLPPSAAAVVAPPVPQENSLKILDSRYPKLSARARTLNILKGNIQLSRSSFVNGKNIPQPVHQISGFKAIASTSTAFVKAGTKFKSDPEQTFCNEGVVGKRILSPVDVPKSAKKPKLESKSPDWDLGKEQLSDIVSEADTWCPPDETDLLSSGDAMQSTGDCDSELLLAVDDIIDPDNRAVTVALEKISEACFDLLPVILSHVFVGNTSRVPVMRDEEKEVVHELGVAKKHLAEPALRAILNKLKKEKMSLSHNCIQSFCRVYVGLCRQLGDLERARLFCYSLLKEDFPQSDRLTLFIGSVWTEIFSSEGVVSKAIELVARQRARGNVLKCLKTYLNWEESAPVKISVMVSSLLLAIKLCPQMEFQFTEEYGEDLKESTWEYVFAIDLLCSHQKWCWTHDNIISKELWPIMDKWMKNRKGSGSVSSPSDLIVATVLRLIGRLGQIGLREGFSSAVENISSVIGVFLQHAKEKDVGWGVQLAAAYALCDLGPSNPSKILEAIQAWEGANTNSLPPAMANAIAEVSNLQAWAERTDVPHHRNRVT